MSDSSSERAPIVGPSTCVSYTQTEESSFAINDPGAGPSGVGSRGRAGTGPYLTTVREDEELMEVSSEQFSGSGAPSSRHHRTPSSAAGGLRPRTRTMSNRFMSSIASVLVFCFLHIDQLALANMPGFDPTSFPVSFGIIVFSYCAHAVFPGIEECMRRPSSYPAMLTVSFGVAAVVKTGMGVLAVLIFGMGTEQEFGRNLEIDANFSFISNSLIFVNVFFSMPLVIYVVVERFDATFLGAFHPAFHRNGSLHWLWIFLTRSLIMTAGLFLSMLVPHFALLMGLVGSFTGTCLCFIFPAWFHLVLKRKQLNGFGVFARVCIIVFGAVSGAIGIFFSALELKRKMV